MFYFHFWRNFANKKLSVSNVYALNGRFSATSFWSSILNFYTKAVKNWTYIHVYSVFVLIHRFDLLSNQQPGMLIVIINNAKEDLLMTCEFADNHLCYIKTYSYEYVPYTHMYVMVYPFSYVEQLISRLIILQRHGLFGT